MSFSCSRKQSLTLKPVLTKYFQFFSLRNGNIKVAHAWETPRGPAVTEKHRVFACRFVWVTNEKFKEAHQIISLRHSSAMKENWINPKTVASAIKIKWEQLASRQHMGGWKLSNLEWVDQEGLYLVRNGLLTGLLELEAAKKSTYRNGIRESLGFNTLVSLSIKQVAILPRGEAPNTLVKVRFKLFYAWKCNGTTKLTECHNIQPQLNVLDTSRHR